MLQAVEATGSVSGGARVGVQALGEGSNDLSLSHGFGHLPIVGIELITGPVDGDVAQLLENEANTVVDITIWRTHVLHTKTRSSHDGLLSPLHLGNNLLVGQGRQSVVGPGVGSQVMALGQLALDDIGVVDDIGTDQEEGSGQLVGTEVVKKGMGGVRRTVVKSQAPGVGTAAGDNIITSAAIAGPVAPEKMQLKEI